MKCSMDKINNKKLRKKSLKGSFLNNRQWKNLLIVLACSRLMKIDLKIKCLRKEKNHNKGNRYRKLYKMKRNKSLKLAMKNSLITLEAYAKIISNKKC